MSKLHNVRGRITYISSHAKQENLYAVYETTDRSYWTELARYNQQEWITKRIRLSIDVFGRYPEMLAGIITTTTMKLALLISKVLTTARELKNKLFHEILEKEYGTRANVIEETITTVDTTPITKKVKEAEPPKVTVTTTVQEAEVVEQPKPQIPPKPVMPPEATAYPKLRKIKTALDKHNEIIFEAERERNALEFERDDLKGFAKLTKAEIKGRDDRPLYNPIQQTNK